MIELGSGDYSSHVNGQGHILSIQRKLTLSPRPTNNLRKRSLGYLGRKRWKVSSCYGLLWNKRAGPYYCGCHNLASTPKMKICHGLLGSSNLVIMVPPPHSEWKIKLSWTNWTSDLERIVPPPPNENFLWITDNLAFIFGAIVHPRYGVSRCCRKNWHFDVGFKLS